MMGANTDCFQNDVTESDTPIIALSSRITPLILESSLALSVNVSDLNFRSVLRVHARRIVTCNHYTQHSIDVNQYLIHVNP
jgi:hypothetical protein